MTNWIRFIRERFEPVSHLLMVAIFYTAHLKALDLAGYDVTEIPFAEIAAIGFAMLLFFFKRRLYDEIKDFETDVKVNPTRPLPRGLLKHDNIYRAIIFCIIAELALFVSAGPSGVIGIAIAIGYSLLMFREFFIPKLIRPHLTTYAVTHTVVSSLLSMATLSALTKTSVSDLPLALLLFSLNSWFLFNVFEFGRKTFASSEERPGVPTYSNIFGRMGALLLTFSQSLVSSIVLLTISDRTVFAVFISLSAAALFLAGLNYVIGNQPASAKVFRTLSSVYIVLIYLGFVICS